MHRASLRLLTAATGALALAACGSQSPPPADAPETDIPEELQSGAAPDQPAAEAGLGTPMEERVATLGLLNKRNNLTEDIELRPGESRRIGDVIIRLSACERTAPWEMPQETGAFVQVVVRDKVEDEWRRIFSGWMFKRSPSLNVVEHPIYDVWVKDCAMSFPGEEDPSPSRPAPTSAPAPAAAPSPAASPSEAASETNEA